MRCAIRDDDTSFFTRPDDLERVYGRYWGRGIPVSLAVDEQYYIQMDPDLDERPRASIWGMDNASTQIAVSVFIERFLPRFLEQCAASTSNPTDLDDND